MLYLLLIFAIIWLIHKANSFERFSRFEQFIIPIYALIMFFRTIDWTLQSCVQIGIIVIMAFFISDYQLKDVELSYKTNRHGLKQLMIKKNRSYTIGWLAVIVSGVLFDIASADEVVGHHLATELLSHLKKEILILSNFTTDSPWYIWLLTGLTTLLYTHRLTNRYKATLGRKAIAYKKLNHQKSKEKWRTKNERLGK